MSQGVPTAATIAAALSFILNKFPVLSSWFGGLSAEAKVAFVIVANVIVGVGTFVLTNSVEALGNTSLWLELVQNVLSAILASQVWHSAVNRPTSVPAA